MNPYIAEKGSVFRTFWMGLQQSHAKMMAFLVMSDTFYTLNISWYAN
jgi:hypothetical protein